MSTFPNYPEKKTGSSVTTKQKWQNINRKQKPAQHHHTELYARMHTHLTIYAAAMLQLKEHVSQSTRAITAVTAKDHNETQLE